MIINPVTFVRYFLAVTIVLICTITACRKHEHPKTPLDDTPPPTITSVSPTSISEQITSTIIITGTNFKPNIDNNEVWLINKSGNVFGSEFCAVRVINASSTSLTVELYPTCLNYFHGYKSGNIITGIMIHRQPLGNSNTVNFTTKPRPIISEITPNHGIEGVPLTITISGINLGSNSDQRTLKIGDVVAKITDSSPNALTATVIPRRYEFSPDNPHVITRITVNDETSYMINPIFKVEEKQN